MAGYGGARPGAGRPPSEATKALREIVNDPKAIGNAKTKARTDHEFWFKLYQQVHGRPAQAIDVLAAGISPEEFLAYRAAFDDGATVESGDVLPAAVEALPESTTP